MPRGLPQKVKNLLEKSRESAQLAIGIYNNPQTHFRSGGFTVLMCIAWTSLLHAIFERKKIKYFYKKGNGRYEIVDGERKAWTLLDSAKKYFTSESPEYKNIDFLVRLRNKIEHRSLPGIDPEIVGECQAFLLNFEDILIKEFGPRNSLIDFLFIPLQLTRDIKSLVTSKDEKKVLSFIKNFRNSLTGNIQESQKFAFKAFLIPKLGNHRTSSNIAIEFVKFDENNPEEMKKYEKMFVGIKERIVPVINAGYLKPTQVLKTLQDNGYKKNMHWHTKMWNKHRVRPSYGLKDPKKCKTDYCRFDEAHGDYLYTPKWISLLINELNTETKRK